jgi:hypothetical protein
MEQSLDGFYTPESFFELYKIIIEAAYFQTLAEKKELVRRRLMALAANDLKTWDDCIRTE